MTLTRRAVRIAAVESEYTRTGVAIVTPNIPRNRLFVRRTAQVQRHFQRCTKWAVAMLRPQWKNKRAVGAVLKPNSPNGLSLETSIHRTYRKWAHVSHVAMR